MVEFYFCVEQDAFATWDCITCLKRIQELKQSLKEAKGISGTKALYETYRKRRNCYQIWHLENFESSKEVQSPLLFFFLPIMINNWNIL